MLEWDKGKDAQHISSTNHIAEMEEQMDSICGMLSMGTQEFQAYSFFSKIHEYIEKNDRLLYTHITNYIFTLDDEGFGVLQTNIDNVVDYMYSTKYEQDFEQKLKNAQKRRLLERTQRTVLKMWDHINLARKQYIMFHHKDEDYEQIVEGKMEKVESKMAKEMNTQLLSLVGIFTALSFLVFGGVSSLDNIFLGAKDIPTLKLIIVGCVWSLCLMNLIFVFMFFVAKLTKLSIKSTDDVNANIVKKYPLIWWSNYAIISILCMACWIYYIRRYGYSQSIDNILSENPTLFSSIGIIVILIVMAVIAHKIVNAWKK